jgi:porin
MKMTNIISTKNTIKIALSMVLTAWLALSLSHGGWAQETASEQTAGQENPSADKQDERYKSGYKEVPQFGGPTSTGAQLEEDSAVKVPLLRFPMIDRALKPWFDWKGRLNKDYGLSFGLDYSALFQWASKSLGKDQAAGGIFRLFGNWTLLGRESGNTGSLVFKVENRHRLGTDIPPQSLGFEAGYQGITGTAFSDFDWGLTNLYWQQRLYKGRISFVAGGVDPTDYVDIYALTNPWTHFQNLVFLTDPTIPVPNQGLGAAFGAMATDHIYVLGGLADTNGDPTRPGDWFDTFFNDGEYFYHLELGWISSFERRYLDNIHLTGWYAARRKKAQVPDGWGLAFSATKFINETWLPFIRAGYSKRGGALLEASVSGGIGYYMSESRDLIGFGVNWGRPPESGKDDQVTGEVFYRLQVAENLAITPNVQLLVNPALNPEENQIWVLGVRGRVSF